MDRRQFLAFAGTSVLAGCGATTDGSTSTTVSPTTGEQPTDTSFTTTPYSAQLEIYSASDGVTVTIELAAESSGAVAYSRTHRMDSGDSVALDSHTEPGTSYRLTLSMNGETVFERPIYDYEGVEITIWSASRVEVTQLVEY